MCFLNEYFRDNFYEFLLHARFQVFISKELQYTNNAKFNKIKIIFPRLTPIKTVNYTPFYLWYGVVLKIGKEIEVEAAATCSEIPLSCPYFAGPRLLYNVVTNIKIDEAYSCRSYFNNNSYKACCV